MTKTTAERLTTLETRFDSFDKALDTLLKDVREMRDSALRRQGAAGAHKTMSARAFAILATLMSLFSGGIGAIMVKKFG